MAENEESNKGSEQIQEEKKEEKLPEQPKEEEKLPEQPNEEEKLPEQPKEEEIPEIDPETKKILEDLEAKLEASLIYQKGPEKINGIEQPVPKNENEEKVGFLNCHLFGGTKLSIFYKKILFEDEERADKIIKYILNSNTEVFILAEVWGDSFIENIIKGVESKYKYSFYPKNGSFLKLGSGLIFLSKKKIIKTNYQNYKDLSMPNFDKGSTKAIAYIITEDLIGYMGTHMDAGSDPEYRKKNLVQVFDLLGELEKHDVKHIILTGDLNIRENEFAVINDGLKAEKNPLKKIELINKKSDEYCYLRDEMGKRGMKDALRIKYPNHLEYPYLTSDSYLNSLDFHWGSNPSRSPSRCRLDYFFVKGIDVCDSGVYFNWMAGSDYNNENALKEYYSKTLSQPMPNIYPVSDHFGIWLIFNKGE